MSEKDRPAAATESSDPDYPIGYALAGKPWEIDYHPTDYSDLGICRVFVKAVRGYMYHCKERGWLTYIDGTFKSDADNALAMGVAHAFADFLLAAARDEYIAAQNKAALIRADEAEGKASKEDLQKVEEAAKAAQAFHAFALKYRDARKIKALMELAAVELHIDVKKLDADPFFLNCPDGVIDLRTGCLLKHSPKHLMTKCARYTPISDGSADGSQLWDDFLNRFTGGNTDLIHYFQELAGSWVIGKPVEWAVFFYGPGGNGKSTALNSIATALGDYYVKLNPDTITTKAQNPGCEIVRLAGARMCLMSEMEEGRGLAASVLKQICTTDDLTGAAKYRAPETFKPTHSVVITTNHLPSVSSNDDGTWDRVKIFQCETRFRGAADDIPDYAAYMLEHGAGPVIMRWIVDGAVEFIDNGFRITEPDCVLAATSNYRDSQDWLQQFIGDCCQETGDKKDRINATELYIVYRGWATERHEFIRNSLNFEAAMKKAGYEKKRTTITTDGVGVKGHIYAKMVLTDLGRRYLGG